jgi:hypothetical protein
MSESFRQQLAATGLQDTAALLGTCATTIKTVSGDIAAALKPVTLEYKGIASLISTELVKLTAASRSVEEYTPGSSLSTARAAGCGKDSWR